MRPYSNIISHNLIRLAAVSNYKLAQLTFATPSQCTLQKTIFIKKMLDDLYSRTPVDWFSQMVRWEFLTAESLEEMTQKDIEMIIDRYKEIIRHFPGDILAIPTVNDHSIGFTENNMPKSVLIPPPLAKVSFSQRLAIELVNLFDMEFTLDLSAPNEKLLDDIDQLYPEKRIEDWSYVEPNCEPPYEPSINSSLEFSESDECEDDISTVSVSPMLTASIHSVNYTDLLDSLSKGKPQRSKPLERIKLAFSKNKKNQQQQKAKGLNRSPSVASSILKRLSPF